MRGIKDLTGQTFGELTVLRLGEQQKRRWKWVVIYITELIGYIETNVVPCCSICNRAKGTMTYEEFLARIGKVAD